MYDLPVRVEVCGESYQIRSDFRAVLDIFAALNDVELSDQDRAEALLDIFYPAFQKMPAEHYQEAVQKCFWFINCGEGQQPAGKKPKLMDWEQDFPYLISPVNRVLGKEARSLKYLHWWTFVSAYHEIGDCLFAQIVRIREKKAKGKKLDKSDQEWYRNNRQIVDLKTAYTEQENNVLKQWLGG